MSYETIIEKTWADRGNLLDVLKAVQAQDGYLTDEGLTAVASAYGLFPSQVYETATFYGMLHVKESPKSRIEVCMSTCCHAGKADDLARELEQAFGGDSSVAVERCECLGRCDTAPNAIVNGVLITNATKEKITAEMGKAGS